MKRPSVPRTVDFDRVAALPRRVPSLADAEHWARTYTPYFLEANAPVGAHLRPWQAYSLREIMINRGGYLAHPVGLGKTLLTYLLPSALDSRRSVLVLPASLVSSGKTWADFQSYVGTWTAPRTAPLLVTRESLALDKNQNLLDDLAPDLVMIDESDDLANSDSAAAARLDRYRLAHPSRADVVYVAMTGTPSRMSLMGYWHLLCWCLLEGAPVPMHEAEARLWAAAIDESTRNAATRPRPGPLGHTIDGAREWYRRRLAETPGVVIADGDTCDQPLTIITRASREDPEMNEKYARFLLEFENPGGITVSDPLSRWMLDGLMGCGVYSYYDPPPPTEWRLARRAVAKFVRDTIARTRKSCRPLDTEGQVLRRHANHPIVVQWRAVKDLFDPRKSTRFAWFTRSTLDSALEWIKESPEPGIVWCGSVEFGRRLASEARLPYYGREGKCEGGGGLHAADATRSMVVSWCANKRGFNLQSWSRALIVMPPQSAKFLEQTIGRQHRSGQTCPVVATILLTSGGTVDAFEAALNEARFARATVSLTQKVLRARIDRATLRTTSANQYRWASRSKG
jgi:hypothetical protein